MSFLKCSNFLLFFLSIIGCQRKSDNSNQAQEKNLSSPSNSNIRVVVFKNNTTKDTAIGGFGYNIYVINEKDTFRIHQPGIPAIPGNKGFKTTADAEKVAALAAQKIKDGNSLPTISIQELDSLGIDIR